MGGTRGVDLPERRLDEGERSVEELSVDEEELSVDEEELSVDGGRRLDEARRLDEERSVDEELSVDKELSVDEEELSVDEELRVEGARGPGLWSRSRSRLSNSRSKRVTLSSSRSIWMGGSETGDGKSGRGGRVRGAELASGRGGGRSRRSYVVSVA